MSDRITSAQDLQKLRDKARSQVELRGGPRETQVVVHMGTCGIAAGARDVLAEMIAQLDANGVQTVTVRQSGCIGLCEQEPMLTYTDKAGRNFLYVLLTRDKVRQIVKRHIMGGEPVEQYIMEGDAK
ncbi:MAG: (2Fe-2S) ferredoxin domain-containing protein [Spirochaetia bacterium]|jgi:NADP-reducing hydrogenase subunit HndB